MNKRDNPAARPGYALRSPGFSPISPWEFLLNRGQRVTPEIAEALAKATGVSPKFWMNMQEAFDGKSVEDKYAEVPYDALWKDDPQWSAE